MDLDSYEMAGVRISLLLVNKLVPGQLKGNTFEGSPHLQTLIDILSEDPDSIQRLEQKHISDFVQLAGSLREVIILISQDIDRAVVKLNQILSDFPAAPSLECDVKGVWHLHHHSLDAELLPMWTAICAEGLARMVGSQHGHRFGICQATGCDRVFFDVSRSGRRRFCSVSCQNRTKMAAFRSRKAKES